MQLCAKCQNDAGKDPIQLRDGTKLCQTCFSQRFAAPVEAPRKNILDTIGRLQSIAAIGAVGVIVLVCFYISQTQNDALNPAAETSLSPTQEARIKAAAAEEEIRRKLADEKRIQDTAKNDALAIVARERAQKERDAAVQKRELQRIRDEVERKAAEKARETAEAEARRKDEADRQAREQEIARDTLRANALSKQELSDAAAKTRADAAKLQARGNEILKQLADADIKRKDNERKLGAFRNIWQTEANVRDKITSEYGRRIIVGKTISNGNSTVTQVDPDGAAAVATRKKAAHEAADARAKYNILNDEMQARWAELEPLRKELDEIKLKLSEMGSTFVVGETHADVLGTANPERWDLRKRAGMRTLYKKDGTTVQIQSAIVVGDQTEYKDDHDKIGRIPTAEVDRIEKNPDTPKPEIADPAKKGKTIDF